MRQKNRQTNFLDKIPPNITDSAPIILTAIAKRQCCHYAQGINNPRGVMLVGD